MAKLAPTIQSKPKEAVPTAGSGKHLPVGLSDHTAHKRKTLLWPSGRRKVSQRRPRTEAGSCSTHRSPLEGATGLGTAWGHTLNLGASPASESGLRSAERRTTFEDYTFTRIFAGSKGRKFTLP